MKGCAMSILAGLKNVQAAHNDFDGEAGKVKQPATPTDAPLATASRAQSLREAAAKTSLAALVSETSRPPAKTASWVIRERATGKVVAETFDKKKVDALNISKYVAVPILDHLAGLNNLTVAKETTTPFSLTPPSESEKAELLALVLETASFYGCPKEEVKEIKESAFKPENVLAALTCFRAMKHIRSVDIKPVERSTLRMR